MPTNKELEKQLKELRKVVEDNAQKHDEIEGKTKWSDSKWAIALQVILATAAIAIAWGQFRVADNQNQISEKQTMLHQFEIVRSLSEVVKDDSLAIDRLFTYFSTLDKDVQKAYLENTLRYSHFDYLSLKCLEFQIQNFKYDSIQVLSKTLNLTRDYIRKNMPSRISIPILYATKGKAGVRQSIIPFYKQTIPWMKLVQSQVSQVSFEKYMKIMKYHMTREGKEQTSLVELIAIFDPGMTDYFVRYEMTKPSLPFESEWTTHIDSTSLTFYSNVILRSIYLRSDYKQYPVRKIWKSLTHPSYFSPIKFHAYRYHLNNSNNFHEYNATLEGLGKFLIERDSMNKDEPDGLDFFMFQSGTIVSKNEIDTLRSFFNPSYSIELGKFNKAKGLLDQYMRESKLNHKTNDQPVLEP